MNRSAVKAEDDLALIVPQPTSEALTSNAVTRTLSDMHAPTWLALLALNITARTLLFHPMQLAVARKRVTREDSPPSTLSLIKASYKGGHVHFSGAKKSSSSSSASSSTGSTYNFGRGGIRGAYRGVGAALVSNLGGEMSYLFTLELLRDRFSAQQSRSDTIASFPASSSSSSLSSQESGEDVPSEALSFHTSSTSAAAGAMCGDVVALGLVTPVVIVASRQMTAGYGMASSNHYTSAWQTFKTVWQTYQSPPPLTRTTTTAAAATATDTTFVSRCVRGARGIYQGASAGLLRVPSSGCWWAIYTKNKEILYTAAAPWLTEWEDEALAARLRALEQGQAMPHRSFWQQNWFLSPTDNPLLNALAGISASVCTTILFNPIAVIQTRQQAIPKTDTRRSAGQPAERVPRWKMRNPFGDVVKVASDLVKREGVSAFFKGTSANVSVAILDGIIFSLLFELTKLGSDNQFLHQLQSSAE